MDKQSIVVYFLFYVFAVAAKTPTLKSEVAEVGSSTIIWSLSDWKTSKEILGAGLATCRVDYVDNVAHYTISVKYSLLPMQKVEQRHGTDHVEKYYSLLAETYQETTSTVYALTLSTYIPAGAYYSINGTGTMLITFGRTKTVMIQEFIPQGNTDLIDILNITISGRLFVAK